MNKYLTNAGARSNMQQFKNLARTRKITYDCSQTKQIPYKTLHRKQIQVIKLGQDQPNNDWKRSHHVYNFDQSRHKYNNIHNSHVLLKGTYAVLTYESSDIYL
jgi:hypothetical protein